VAEARHEPATPLFANSPNQTQHDGKAVSTSCARKLASDSATALQINSPPAQLHSHYVAQDFRA